MDRRELWATRLALQQLVGDPAEDPVSAVASSLAVQSQDVPLAHDSLAQRTGGTAAQAADALNAGHIIRTHVLRPTWHHVAAADARWLLALTSPKVLSGMRARHRQLGLDEPGTLAAELDVLLAEVAAGPRTRADLGVVFARRWERQDALFWQRLSHLCMIAELEAQICSGPVDPAGLNGHTYVLAETRLPATPPRPRDEAIADVVERFFASHGPVAVRDLQRWTRLTLGEIRGAIAALGPRLDSVKVADQTLWFGADAMAARGPGSAGFAAARRRAEGAWLLSTFDEASLDAYDSAAAPCARWGGERREVRGVGWRPDGLGSPRGRGLEAHPGQGALHRPADRRRPVAGCSEGRTGRPGSSAGLPRRVRRRRHGDRLATTVTCEGRTTTSGRGACVLGHR